jgi:outer membrane cobalamin receptor
MYDGVPMNLTGGFLDIQGLTLTNVERVEVARGPQSALHGSSAISGVVQFITRRGRPGPPQIDLLAEGGGATDNGGRARAHASVAGGISTIRYSAGAGVAYQRGIYDLPHDLLTRDVSLRIDANPAERWALGSTVRYLDIESNLPVRDPGVTRAPLDPNQGDARNRLVTSLWTEFDAMPSWRHRIAASVFRDEFTYEDQQDGLDPANFPFFVFDFNFTLRSELWRPSVEYVMTNDIPIASEASQLSVSYGARAEWEDLSTEQGGDFGDNRADFDRNNQAVFAELQGTIGSRVSFLAGGRFEEFKGLTGQFLPRASLAIELIPDVLRLRAAAGRAFKAPNLQQQFLENPFTVPNPDLDPETSVSWEGGLTTTTPDQRLAVRATVFYQRHQDLIRTVQLEGTTQQTNRNLGESRAVGVEFEIERVWSDRVRMGANTTWVESEIIDNAGLPETQFPEGSRLPTIPTVTGTAFVELRPVNRLVIVTRGRWVGEQTVFTERFSGERIDLDPYFLADVTTHILVNHNLGTYVRLENLLDSDYGTAFDRPGIPLTAIVGVRVSTE